MTDKSDSREQRFYRRRLVQMLEHVLAAYKLDAETRRLVQDLYDSLVPPVAPEEEL